MRLFVLIILLPFNLFAQDWNSINQKANIKLSYIKDAWHYSQNNRIDKFIIVQDNGDKIKCHPSYFKTIIEAITNAKSIKSIKLNDKIFTSANSIKSQINMLNNYAFDHLEYMLKNNDLNHDQPKCDMECRIDEANLDFTGSMSENLSCLALNYQTEEKKIYRSWIAFYNKRFSTLHFTELMQIENKYYTHFSKDNYTITIMSSSLIFEKTAENKKLADLFKNDSNW